MSDKVMQVGDRVRIEGNEIFQCMGFKSVTGKVTVINGTSSFSILCDQTGCYEGADFGDGMITLIGSNETTSVPVVVATVVTENFGDRMSGIRSSLMQINALIDSLKKPDENKISTATNDFGG